MAGCASGPVRVWALRSDAEITMLNCQQRDVNGVAASTRAEWILAGFEDGSVLLRIERVRTARGRCDSGDSMKAAAQWRFHPMANARSPRWLRRS